MLTMALRVQGKDQQGHAFDVEGRTLILSRYGACIYSTHPLRYGQFISLYSPTTMRRAGFRVVGPVEPYTDQGGEWAVETTDPEVNLWGIGFPPLSKEEIQSQKALLECHTCHEVMLVGVTLGEADVLETAGIIEKQCAKCNNETPWGYPIKQLSGAEAPPAAAPAAQSERDRRTNRRSALQLPLMVRDFLGHSETLRTENLSKTGLCFISSVNYLMGQGLVVLCPYNPSEPAVGLRARVVRREENAALGKCIYGVRYEPPRKK
jgi:PilZ domain-containing protein